MEYRSVYITFPDPEEARRIGQALVESRLVACVNIFDGIDSIYWWEGKIENAREVALIAKTRESLCDKLIEKVKQLHSYEVPCVCTWPIREVLDDYAAWIEEETRA